MIIAASTGDVAALFVEFGVLLLGLGLLARFAHRFGISPVPLYLLVGLAFGEGGLLGIQASDDFVQVVAELGVVLLLLLLGLEYSGQELLKSARKSVRAGVVDIVANAAPGVVLALIFGWGLVGAVALGGITYISSSGIVSQLVRDLRWRRNPETPRVVSVLIMEDLVMAPYLPVLTLLLTGAGLISGLITVSIALLVVVAVLVISVKGSPKFHRLLDASDPVGLLLLVFGAAIAAAGLAGYLGFSPVVAAFLVGLLLTGEVAEVARRRLDPLRDLLAAVFFAYFGLTANLQEMPAVLVPAVLLAIVTTGTKFLTGWNISKTALSTNARLRAGALLTARGEFSVVIAGLVATSAVLPSKFNSLVATYVIITATAAPFLARAIGNRSRPAKTGQQRVGGDPG